MADRNKEALLEVRWCFIKQTADVSIIPANLERYLDELFNGFLCITSGMFLWWLSVCARDRGHLVAQRRWEKVMEEALLPPQGFGDLLCPQRQSQGQ